MYFPVSSLALSTHMRGSIKQHPLSHNHTPAIVKNNTFQRADSCYDFRQLLNEFCTTANTGSPRYKFPHYTSFCTYIVDGLGNIYC